MNVGIVEDTLSHCNPCRMVPGLERDHVHTNAHVGVVGVDWKSDL